MLGFRAWGLGTRCFDVLGFRVQVHKIARVLLSIIWSFKMVSPSKVQSLTRRPKQNDPRTPTWRSVQDDTLFRKHFPNTQCYLAER